MQLTVYRLQPMLRCPSFKSLPADVKKFPPLVQRSGISGSKRGGGQIYCRLGAGEEARMWNGDVEKGDGCVMVLFKNDLRLDDHPGVEYAKRAKLPIVPCYCVDPELSRYLEEIPGGVELLWGALKALKDALTEAGSDLVIRIGSWADEVLSTIEEFRCSLVVMEQEVESKWCREIEKIKQRAPFLKFHEWCLTLHAEHIYQENFEETMKKSSIQTPFEFSFSLTGLPVGASIPTLPPFAQLKRTLSSFADTTMPIESPREDPFQGRNPSLWKSFSSALTSDLSCPVSILHQYLELSKSQTKNGSNHLILNQMLAQAEDARFSGISFMSLFGLPLSLGLISSRRLHQEIIHHQRQNDSLFLFEDPYARAVRETCASFDFHRVLAYSVLKNGCESTPGNSELKFWRWQGMLLEYAHAYPKARQNRQTVVLVHGFGASCMHWRRNVDFLTDAGYRVFAPTLPGYGRSQKCYLKYSETVWRESMVSFIKEIVKEPVVLVGNSIGGFVAAQTAAHHPHLVKALVLLNPAGRIDPDYTPQERTPIVPFPISAFLIHLFSRALLFYLSKTAQSTLHSLYPVNTKYADKPFLDDMLRSAADPNAVSVLKSVFFLLTPVPLDYLLHHHYKGRVLLLQGAQDPLNRALERAERLSALRPGITVEVVTAGHCPHDEIPHLVNPRLTSFLNDVFQVDVVCMV